MPLTRRKKLSRAERPIMADAQLIFGQLLIIHGVRPNTTKCRRGIEMLPWLDQTLPQLRHEWQGQLGAGRTDPVFRPAGFAA
jgi:hypothetical protein